MLFKDLKLNKDLLATLELVGYKKPSPIQEKAIPVALEGKDIIGQAQTGTGKTAAFGLPIIEKTEKNPLLQHVILAPSRELASQIYNELHKLSANQGIKVIEIIGGISYTIQRRALKSNPNIIVATPGRFIDNLEKGLINLNDIKTFTLDEADEMLNFGFYKEIMKIKTKMPKNIQTFFFTATFNAKIRKLASEILTDPVSVTISEGLSSSAQIDQKYLVLKERNKLNALVSLLHMLKPKSAVIFGRTKRRVDELSGALRKLGFNAVGIQGDMRQRERGFAMQNFRDGNVNIIVGTDVIARGIDVDGIDFVFNFDLPTELEYYTHRIGRTGRAGKRGVAISFIKDGEISYFKEIMKVTGSTAEKWPMPTDKDLAEVKQKMMMDSLDSLLTIGKGRYEKVGKNIAIKYQPEELGIIIAQLLIGNKPSAHSISLTGEASASMKRKGGGSNRRRRSGSSRNRSNGNRSNNRSRPNHNKKNFSKNKSNQNRNRSNSGQNRKRK